MSSSITSPGVSNNRKAMVWFRGTDLRVRDNVALVTAHEQCDHVSHVCFINSHNFSPVSDGGPKMGWKRFLFFYECVSDVHASLMRKNAQQLTLIQGDPTQLIPLLCLEHGFTDIYCFDEAIHDERLELERLKSNVSIQCPHVNIHTYWGGGTLISPNAWPYPIEALDTYTKFRKDAEAHGLSKLLTPVEDEPTEYKPIVQLLNAPTIKGLDIKPLDNPDFYEYAFHVWDEICEIQGHDDWKLKTADGTFHSEVKWFLEHRERESMNAFPWRGGESSAWRRMNHYITSGSIASYRQERNGMVGTEYSTKLSPFLALGCITSSQIYHEIKAYEATIGGEDQNTSLIVAELLWRDYMRFYSLKYGNKLFLLGGVQGKAGWEKHTWGRDFDRLKLWVEGKTGYPTVDAHMKELSLTGYMSNRGRQVVASFLVRDLNLDWRLGAEVFERLLLDYDACSNYGNWQYSAGIGTDPRDDRYFNIVKQSFFYDPHCIHIRKWLGNAVDGLSNDQLHDAKLIPESFYAPSETTNLAKPCVELLHYQSLENVQKIALKAKKSRSKHGSIPGVDLSISHN